jgi:hypothetical protein
MAAGAALVPAEVLAHGPQIQTDVVDGHIQLRAIAPDSDYQTPLPPTYVYPVGMAEVPVTTGGTEWVSNANAAEHTGPGFVIVQNRFADGTLLNFRILDELKVWNGATFVATTPEEVEASRSRGLVTAVTGDSPNPRAGFDLMTIANEPASQHTTVKWRLLGDGTRGTASSDDGVYALKLQLFNTTAAGGPTGIADSAPFYLLLNKNVSPDQAAAAFSYAQTLVPEPGSLSLLALAGLLALRRKR